MPIEFLQLAGQLIIQPVAAQAAKWIGDTLDGTSKVAAHAVLGAAVTTLLGTGWQTGAAAGALGDLLPQALEKAFEKDENGRIKNEEAFKAANTIISAALTSATGSDIANTINAGMVTQNAVENNYLGHTQLQIMADRFKACTTEQCKQAVWQSYLTKSEQQSGLTRAQLHESMGSDSIDLIKLICYRASISVFERYPSWPDSLVLF